MKSRFFILLLWLTANWSLLFGQAMSAGERETITPEEYKNLEKMKNRRGFLHARLNGITTMLKAYQNTHDGKWPESWQQVEDEIGAGIWESPQIKEQVIRSFVLLPRIEGQMALQTPYPYKLVLMLVMAEPMEIKKSDRVEIGRWIIFENQLSNGRPGMYWFPEKDLQGFSAWPQVQSAIDQHLKTLPLTPSPLQPPQNPAPDPLVAKPHSAPVPKIPKPLETAESSRVPWLAWAGVIFAAIGVLWLALKKRRS